jgi:hypothetical protein
MRRGGVVRSGTFSGNFLSREVKREMRPSQLPAKSRGYPQTAPAVRPSTQEYTSVSRIFPSNATLLSNPLSSPRLSSLMHHAQYGHSSFELSASPNFAGSSGLAASGGRIFTGPVGHTTSYPCLAKSFFNAAIRFKKPGPLYRISLPVPRWEYLRITMQSE